MPQQPPAAKRTFYVPTMDEMGQEDAEIAERWLGQMLTTLLTVGGTLIIQTDRVRVGNLGDEPLAVTAGLFAKWTSQAGKLREPEQEPETNTPTEDPAGVPAEGEH